MRPINIRFDVLAFSVIITTTIVVLFNPTIGGLYNGVIGSIIGYLMYECLKSTGL